MSINPGTIIIVYISNRIDDIVTHFDRYFMMYWTILALLTTILLPWRVITGFISTAFVEGLKFILNISVLLVTMMVHL